MDANYDYVLDNGERIHIGRGLNDRSVSTISWARLSPEEQEEILKRHSFILCDPEREARINGLMAHPFG